jgi:hypothetical protein
MKKPVYPILYLMAVTLVVFYLPKIIARLSDSGPATSMTLAAGANMEENVYFALREVASVQLGYVQISYEVDEESGQCKVRFNNAACVTMQADPEQLKAQMKIQQDELHKQILLLGPLADEDESGSVSREEGARFRDLFEFGHLAAHCPVEGIPDLPRLAQAVGLDSTEVEKKLSDYRQLKIKSPEKLKTFFP